MCWDVIFADPAKNISGHWLSRNADEIIHMECYNFLRERQLEERHPGMDLEAATTWRLRERVAW